MLRHNYSVLELAKKPRKIPVRGNIQSSNQLQNKPLTLSHAFTTEVLLLRLRITNLKHEKHSFSLQAVEES